MDYAISVIKNFATVKPEQLLDVVKQTRATIDERCANDLDFAFEYKSREIVLHLLKELITANKELAVNKEIIFGRSTAE